MQAKLGTKRLKTVQRPTKGRKSAVSRIFKLFIASVVWVVIFKTSWTNYVSKIINHISGEELFLQFECELAQYSSGSSFLCWSMCVWASLRRFQFLWNIPRLVVNFRLPRPRSFTFETFLVCSPNQMANTQSYRGQGKIKMRSDSNLHLFSPSDICYFRQVFRRLALHWGSYSLGPSLGWGMILVGFGCYASYTRRRNEKTCRSLVQKQLIWPILLETAPRRLEIAIYQPRDVETTVW